MNIFEDEEHFNKKSTLELRNSSNSEQLLKNINNLICNNPDPFF